MAMEIINTKPGYKINCTWPRCTLGTNQPGVSHKHHWNYFGKIQLATGTNTFSNLDKYILQFELQRASRVCAAQQGCRQPGRKYDWMQPMN